MNTIAQRSGTWLWLSLPIALLGGIASAAGILYESTYERDTEHFGVQAVSQDYVTLFVAVPVVLLLGWMSWRGSFAARLMWHGVAFYFTYTYAIASFMVQANAMFLVYTTLLACSIFALVGGMATLGWPVNRSAFGPSWPRRSVVAFLGIVVVVFLFLWLSDIVPALIGGTQPESLAESATPTNGVEVLDLSLLLPGAALIAYWVWKAEPRGYVFATGLLAYVALLGLALVAMIVGLASADLSADAAVSLVFVLAAAVAIVLLVFIVRSTEKAPRERRSGVRVDT